MSKRKKEDDIEKDFRNKSNNNSLDESATDELDLLEERQKLLIEAARATDIDKLKELVENEDDEFLTEILADVAETESAGTLKNLIEVCDRETVLSTFVNLLRCSTTAALKMVEIANFTSTEMSSAYDKAMEGNWPFVLQEARESTIRKVQEALNVDSASEDSADENSLLTGESSNENNGGE